MKKLVISAFSLFPLLGFSQKKLFSVSKGDYPLNNNDSLYCYYFPLKENMSNPNLSYYQKNPTLTSILHIANTMPCDSFVVKRGGGTLLTVNLKKDSTWKFVVRDLKTRLDTSFNSELIGAMTEHRSIELISNGYDKKAGQVFGKLNFNNQQIQYITTKNLESAIFKVIDIFLYNRKNEPSK